MAAAARARRHPLVVGVAALVSGGLALSACGASAGDLAKASCAHVTT